MFKKSWPFILLALLSFALHFSFLSYPAQVVFDEVHFGKFVAAYSTGQYYFDIHPPLGKLMIAGFTKLTGVSPVFDFSQIGQAMPAKTLFALRFMPAFFGSLFVLLFSWLAYLISRNKTTALIAGFLILLDNAFLGQSKFILVDIFMFSFQVLTLAFFFLWQKQKSFSAKWFAFLGLTGLFAGLTASVKWTGLAVIGIIGIVLLAKVFSKKLSSYLGQNDNTVSITIKIKELFVGSFFLLIIAFGVYLAPFYLHFKLLPNSGSGDAFMSQPFQLELKYGRDNVYQPLSFWQKFVELNKTMYSANASLSAEHPFGSRWYSWPLNVKPVYYWNQEEIIGQAGWKAKIYLSGNPLLWWLAGLSTIFTLLTFCLPKVRRRLSPIFFILLLGFFANLLPFILITRVSFLYHYLPSLIYAILILALWLARLWPKDKAILSIIMALVLLSFVLLSPLSYGWPMPPRVNLLELKIINLFN
ncbi:MAG TPA: phospholipid carrier-dependent glycosyltransferase [Candidatus Portnoybacteria bacterium]|nr:phospholipid carrier-dependent glycosyltransferase [Candidatus Portnoybacteria bacterium]